MNKLRLLFCILFLSCNSFAADHFWIGGTGNWSDTLHWSPISGGAAGSTIPGAGDNAIFDDSSTLILASIVTVDVPAVMDTFDFSAVVVSFTFDSPLVVPFEVRASILGNASGVNFTGTWGEIEMSTALPGESITSSGTIWAQDFRFLGGQVLMNDDFNIGANRIYVDTGGVDVNNITVTCSEFYSNTTKKRDIDITNTVFNVTNGYWEIDSNSLVWTASGSSITLGDNLTIAEFYGGDLAYDTLYSSTATEFRHYGDNSFDLVSVVTSSQFKIDNGANLSTDSLIAGGVCGSPLFLSTVGPGAAATFTKTGYSVIDLIGIDVTKVHAGGGNTYNLALSAVSNSTGWNLVGANYYWIGDGGNWNDAANWSFSTGGVSGGCIPTLVDSVFFDVNSFSVTAQTVLVDDTAFFKTMDWTGIIGNQNFVLDSSAYAYGNVTLHPNLTVNRNVITSAIVFKDQAELSPNASTIDCSFLVLMEDAADSLLLMNDLVMSDTSSIVVFSGELYTQNNGIKTGSLFSIDNPSGTSDLRKIDFGNSFVELLLQFNADGDDTYLTFVAGNSHLYIGDTSSNYGNALIAPDLTFYDVTLNYQPLTSLQLVSGDNTYNKLTVVPGSKVHLQEGDAQTVTDSLILNGNCQDMIIIASSDTTATANTAALIKQNSVLDFIGQGLEVQQIDASSGLLLTTYHSVDNTGNVNWDFSATSTITAAFTADGPYCFGDTTNFTNTSSTTGSITYNWLYNDGTGVESPTGLIQANTAQTLNFSQDPGIDTTAYGQILPWTEIVDAQSLFTPASGSATTITGYELLNYSFTVAYRMSLINGTGSDAYLVDMDASATEVSNQYRPRIKIYKNGSDYSANLATSSVFDEHEFYEDTISNGSLQIGADTVSFDVSAFNLEPTDILTIYFGSDVSYTSDLIQPRWKATNDTLGTDVSIDYELIIDSIYFEAIPATSSYNLDTTQHVFLSSGDFNVTLVTTNGVNHCTDTATQLVHINQPSIYLSTSEPDTTICLGDTVTFDAYSADTLVQFEYYYNGVSQNLPSINDTLYMTNTLANLDTISVLAYENGCVSDSMPQFIYVVNDLPVYTFVSDDADSSICAGDSVLFTGSSADLSYDYKFLVDGTGVTAVMDTIGYYTVDTLADNNVISVVVVDDNGCTDTTSMIFNVNPLPTTSMTESTGGNVICENQLVTFTGNGADLYEFFLNDTTVQGPLALATFAIDSLEFGDTITVMGSSSLGCNYMATESYTYIVNPIPSTTITSSDADDIICSGETVTFTSSGAAAYDFQINGVSVQFSGTASYITSSLNNNDTVVIVGHLGACSFNSTEIIMTVLASPTTVLTNDDNGDNTVCAGTPVTFTGSGATNYEFFIDGSSVQGPSATDTYTTSGLLNGQTITVEGESNTCIVSQSESFTILSNPSVSFFSSDGDNTICDGDGIVFTGANAANYEFFVNTASTQGPSATSTLTNPALLIGSNAIQVVGIGGNGCTDTSAVINLTVNAIPTLTMTSSDADDIICAGESVTFTGTGGDMYQFYVDGTPQGAMSGTNTFTTFGLTNAQSVYFNGSLIGCTSVSNSIITTVNPIPSTSLTSTDVDNIYCADELINYTATGATNYEFIVNGTSVQGPGVLNTLNSAAFPTGSYDVEVIGEASNCSSSSILNITINAVPTAALSSSDVDNIICQGESVTYTGAGGSLYEFFINGGSQGASSPTTTFNSNSLIDTDVVSVEVTSAQGCTNTDTYLPITVNPTPIVVLTSSDLDNIICLGDNVDFTGSGATLYEFFINGVSQGAPSILTTISTAGLANGDIIEVVGSSLGCSSTSNNLTFTVYGAPVVTLTNNGDNTLCVGEWTDLVAAGASNYQFYVNGMPIGGLTPIPTFNLALNNGNVVTVEGETNGCFSTALSSETYIVYNYPTISSSASSTTICINDVVNFTASGAMTYDFDINGTIVQSGPLTTFDISTLSNGDVVTVTGYNGDCASTPDVYNFIVNSMNLDLTVSASSMICAGENATFTASGANEYEFFLNGVSQGAMSTTNTYSSSTLSDLDEITFTGYSTSTLCTQPFSDYILMNVIDEPTITAMSNIDFCEGDSVILVSNLEYGNQWYVDGNPIAGATDTSYVAYTSGAYSLDVTSGGVADVWSFGQNATGSFGNGNNFNSADPTVASTPELFSQLSSGYDFLLGVTISNEVYAWGENSSGQLGDGTYTSSNLPQIVPTLANIKNVATTESSCMAVDASGNGYVWGNNAFGQLATGNTNVINFPFLNAALTNIDSIAGGRSHFVILKTDGTVWAVGSNDNGQLGQGNLTNSMNAIQVPGLANVVSVGAGEHHSFAIDNLGDLYVWGNNGSGQLGLDDLTNRLDPALSPLKNVINAQGGASHSAFLTSNEKVFTAGNNTFGQLGSGNFTNSTIPVEVTISGADMISTGQYTTLVKREDKSVFGFGNNTEDQLSLSGLSINTPEHITDLDGVSFIEASKSSSHVIYSEDQLCSSQATNVNMMTVPVVTITGDGDTLTTIAGTSYQWYFNGNPIPGATSQTLLATESGDYHVEVTFANGCTGVSDVYYHSMVSIKDLSLGNVNVFPNPTNESINIQLSQELTEATNVEVRDQSGRIVKEVLFTEGVLLTMNVSELENGIYHILIHNTTLSGNIRFVKSSK